jgi:hypothetical protein
MKSVKRPSPFLQHAAIGCLILLPFLHFLFRDYLNLDFWFDEINTLKHFVFPGLVSAASEYPVPNNHIFFNIANGIYLKAIGIGELFSLMDRPYAIRLLMLSYSIAAFGYVYRIGSRFYNQATAWVAVAILATTIPYYNFAVQVRGYGLSIFLLSALIYHAFSWERSRKKRDALLVAVLGALLLYTIPLNLYVLASLMVYYGIAGAGQARRRHPLTDNPNLILAACLSGSIFLALLLYGPVLDSLFSNSYVKSAGFFNARVLTDVLPKTFFWFLSDRYLLLPALAIGPAWFLFSKKESVTEANNPRFGLLLLLLLLPFAMSYVRGGNPFYRVFVNLTPIFALFAAAAVTETLRFLCNGKRAVPAAAAAVLVFYCQVIFAGEVVANREKLGADIRQSKISQNLYRNYYQAHYRPLALAMDLVRQLRMHAAPVYTYDIESSLPVYLAKFGIRHREINSPKMLKAIDPQVLDAGAYFISKHPDNFIADWKAVRPDVTCRFVFGQEQFHSVLWCRAKEPALPDGATSPPRGQ